MIKTIDNRRVAFIVVAYKSEDFIDALLTALVKEKKPLDRIVVIDNDEGHHFSAQKAQKNKYVDVVVESQNIGFARGCNEAVRQAGDVDLLIFVNPDAVPLPGSLDTLRNYDNHESVGGWMPLIIKSKTSVNTAGNKVHVSGLSWCGDFDAHPSQFKQPKRISFLSGACVVIPKGIWEELNGFPEDFFTYYEDTDFSTRLQLSGRQCYLVPASKVMHDYEFTKSSNKWLSMERNRHLYIIRTWPTAVIFLLAPSLAISEIGLWLVSIKERRLKLKIRSSLQVVTMLKQTLSDRKKIQKKRKISSRHFLNLLDYSIDTKQLPKSLRSKWIEAPYRANYIIAHLVLKLFS